MKTLIFVSTLLFSSITSANDLSIQDRILRLEQLTAGSQNKADIIFELEKIQQQVNELRGSLEVYEHRIKNLADKQQLLYTDIYARLANLEGNKLSNNQEANETTVPTEQNTQATEAIDSNQNTTPDVTEIPEPILVNEDSAEIEQNDYDVAFSHLRAGRFNESARQFEIFIKNHPNSLLIDNAQYWLGESYYVQRQYPQALSAFQDLVSNYPNSKKISDSMLKVGYTYFELNDVNNAKLHLQKVIDSFPNTSVARLAKNRLSQIQRGN